MEIDGLEELREVPPPQVHPIAHPDLIFFSQIIDEREFLDRNDVDPEVAERLDSLKRHPLWRDLVEHAKALPELRTAYMSRDEEKWHEARPRLLDLMARFSETCFWFVPSVLRPIVWRFFWDHGLPSEERPLTAVERVPMRWTKPDRTEPTSTYNWRYASLELWDWRYGSTAWDSVNIRHLLIWCDVRGVAKSWLENLLHQCQEHALGPEQSKRFSYKGQLVRHCLYQLATAYRLDETLEAFPGFDAVMEHSRAAEKPDETPSALWDREKFRASWERYVKEGKKPDYLVHLLQVMVGYLIGFKPPPKGERIMEDSPRIDKATVHKALSDLHEAARVWP